MAKTVAEHYHSIIEKLTKFKPKDDFSIPEGFIISKMHDIRAMLIREDWRNRLSLNEYYQEVCCLDIVCEEQGCDINGLFIPSGTIIYKSVLPDLLTGVNNDNIKYFGGDGFTQPFVRRSFDGWRNLQGNKWTAQDPTYTVVSNVAYIKNLPTVGMAKACALILADRPETVCGWTDDSLYPVPSEYKLELLVCKDILSTWGIQSDNVSDAQDSPSDPRLNQQIQKQANV